MSADARPHLPYAGKRIGDLRGPRSRVALPSADEATLLPDPRVAHAALLDRFRVVNGPKDAPTAFPNMSARDARAFANVVTFALRNDLTAFDHHDAAVIWDKWRQAIDDVRDHLKPVRDDDLTNDRSPEVWNACIVLDHRAWDLRESMVVSLAKPGEVFRQYCPWRSAWATYERIYRRAA